MRDNHGHPTELVLQQFLGLLSERDSWGFDGSAPVVKSSPPLNMYEEDRRIMVAMPLPGMEPASISIRVMDDGLRVRTPLRGPGQIRTQEYLVQEWTTGPSERTVDLPKPVDATRANASYHNGVLVVMLPVAPKAVPGAIRMAKIGTAKGQVIGQTGHVQ